MVFTTRTAWYRLCSLCPWLYSRTLSVGMDETQAIAESKVAEAANAAAVAHEANSVAREAQMHETLVRALKEVLVDGASEERPMLIKRIPFICKDIVTINEKLNKIDSSLTWATRLVLGAVILEVLATLWK